MKALVPIFNVFFQLVSFGLHPLYSRNVPDYGQNVLLPVKYDDFRGNQPGNESAVLEPELFDSVKLLRSLNSWSDIIESGISCNQLVNVVHGALKTYDLDNLAAILGAKLTIEEPVDACGQQITKLE